MQPMFLFEDVDAILVEMQRSACCLLPAVACPAVHAISSLSSSMTCLTCACWLPHAQPDALFVCSHGSLKPNMAIPDIVSLLARDGRFAGLLLLRLDVRAQVRQGVPRMKYP